ncbi:GM17423 [Drosophila sechellia]|uniref:GM17423 n=1 Tax=Drosophila sechellia TaxID=7238 RepID=B4IQ39_DROSE|nr:GM17423 [Drosophila sechellia]
MSEKYNVQLNMEKTIILNNRKFIGTLVTHRVRNEDIKRAPSAYGFPAALNSRDGAPQNSGKLVQEIDEKDAATICRLDVQYIRSGGVSSQKLSLVVGEDRIVVESHKYGYVFNKFVNYRLQQDRAQALFDKTSRMLRVRIPVFTN